MIFTCMLVFVL